MSKGIVRLYYYEETGNGDIMDWVLTSDKEYAMKQKAFRTARLSDIDKNGYLGDTYEDTIIQIDEGLFIWNRGDEVFDIVDDVKDAILSRMEKVGLENSRLYEELVGMREYRINAWMNKNECGWILG